MAISGKVQTNDEKVNVLVDFDGSSNRHYSHLDFPVEVEKVLTNEEIIAIAEANKDSKEYLELCKSLVKRIPGYATASSSNKPTRSNTATGGEFIVEYSDIVKYKKSKI